MESLTQPLLIQGISRADPITKATSLPRPALTSITNCSPGCPANYPAGQRQRIALTRALVTEPKLLLLDEPVSAVDAAIRVQVLEILKGLRADGAALVFVSHDTRAVGLLRGRRVRRRRGTQYLPRPGQAARA